MKIRTKSQEKVFANLKKIAHFKFGYDPAELRKLPLKLRTNTLICGSSGIGKTRLVSDLADELKVPLLRINVSTWSVWSSKSEPYTWETIAEFVKENEYGIIFVDEIDKLTTSQNSDWVGHIRLEIHDLLDGFYPTQVERKEQYSLFECLDEQTEEASFEEVAETQVNDYQQKLTDQFLIIGAGAWQKHWDDPVSKFLGFNPDSAEIEKESLSEKEILSSLSAELRRRFRSEILVIQKMERDDYYAVIRQLCQSLPEPIRARFAIKATNRIGAAFEKNLQFRLLEDVLQETVLESFFEQQKTTQKGSKFATSQAPEAGASGAH